MLARSSLEGLDVEHGLVPVEEHDEAPGCRRLLHGLHALSRRLDRSTPGYDSEMRTFAIVVVLAVGCGAKGEVTEQQRRDQQAHAASLEKFVRVIAETANVSVQQNTIVISNVPRACSRDMIAGLITPDASGKTWFDQGAIRASGITRIECVDTTDVRIGVDLPYAK